MRYRLVALLLVPALGAGIALYRRGSPQPPGTLRSAVSVGHLSKASQNILEGAKLQAEQRAVYNASYMRIAYPNGDVPITQGACTDVVIRALRRAGFDLQKLIHEDMQKRWSDYPRKGDAPDSNIDHRRVPNQICFFKKYGRELTTSVESDDLKHWQPGDFVYWKAYGRDHTGVVSDAIGPSGYPMVIHNIGECIEEDCLTAWPIVGHYRYPKA